MATSDIAYHEAGHAVAGLVLGLPVDSATIIPNEDLLGLVRIWRLGEEREGSQADVEICENQIVSVLAGQVAENKHTEREDEMCGTDRERVVEEVPKLASDGPEASDLLEKLWKKAKAIIDDHWRQVEAVANALLVQRTLTFDEMVRLIIEAVKK